MSYEPRAAFAGQIAEVSVVELLQTILQGGHTGVARFETPVGAATLWFREGALVDADMGRHHMEAAVQRLLALESGTFEVEFKTITRRQVMTATTAEMIASVPPRPGAPTPVPNDENDASRRRRRAGVSWHPTGGGKPSADSGPVPVVRSNNETSGAAVRSAPAPAPVVAAASPSPSMPQRAPLQALAARVGPNPEPTTAPPQAPVGEEPRVDAVAHSRHTQFGFPAAVAGGSTAFEPDDEDRTLMRSSPSMATFVPPLGPSEVPSSPPLQVEERPAQWGTGTMVAVIDAPRLDSTATANLSVASTSTLGPSIPAVATAVAVPTPIHHAPASAPIESGREPTASGEFEQVDRTMIVPSMATAPPPGWTLPLTPTAPPPQALVVAPVVAASQTMTAGSIRRSTPAQPSRPGAARRTDRVSAVAGAIGMSPLPQERREVSEIVRLDQQVEAAGAAGLTGASAPAVVGRYEVLLRIARGGMGTVYLARVTGEGGFRRLFALKVVRDHLSQNDEYVRMLLHEARVASRLHHPNVVGIVDIGTLANQHYLVMDYVEGCTFSELLKVHRRTRPAHLIIPIVLDALMGLHAAHSLVDDDNSPLTLVHCDFSPQNMLVGTNGICRITDFGISKATNVINDRPSITRGKPAYVSPEQVTGRPLDHRSDIFSAGVVLWNALTGEQLFGGDSPEQTLQLVLQRPVPLPSTVGLRPPSCFDRVCLRALERDPARRYQTAEEMLIELRRIAIAQDYLAPSSDVGRWVTESFGRQLELRRQAAGISRPLGADSQPMSLPAHVPELGLGDAELTSETRALPADYGQTPAENDSSRTSLLRSEAVAPVSPEVSHTRGPTPAIGRSLLVLAAVAMATAAIAIAILRPEWIQGKGLDNYGRPIEDAEPADEPNETEGRAETADDPKGEPKPGKPGDTKLPAEGGPPNEPDATVKPADPDAPTPGAPTPGAPTPGASTTTPVTPPAPAEPLQPSAAPEPKPKKPKKPAVAPNDSGDDVPVAPPDPGDVLDGPPG